MQAHIVVVVVVDGTKRQHYQNVDKRLAAQENT